MRRALPVLSRSGLHHGNEYQKPKITCVFINLYHQFKNSWSDDVLFHDLTDMREIMKTVIILKILTPSFFLK